MRYVMLIIMEIQKINRPINSFTAIHIVICGQIFGDSVGLRLACLRVFISYNFALQRKPFLFLLPKVFY